MSDFKQIAIKAVKEAEKIILKYYNKNIDVDFKQDQTPVTLADRRAEKIIKKLILTTFPDHNFLGEEEGGVSGSSKYRWILDPIDGTKNFMRQISFWGTLLALEKNGELVLAVTNSPIFQKLVVAEKGKGAYENGKKIKVSNINSIAESFIVHGSLEFFDKINKIAPLVKLYNQAVGHRGFGDFWAHLLVAEGRADCMIEAAVKYWDIAATKLIIEEAGGKVTDLYGDEINDKSTTFLASNGKIHKQVLDIFNLI